MNLDVIEQKKLTQALLREQKKRYLCTISFVSTVNWMSLGEFYKSHVPVMVLMTMMVMTTKTTFDECRESRDPLLLADDVVADVSIGLTARLLVLTIKVLKDPGNWSQQCSD